MAGAQVVHHGLLSSRCPRRARITGEGIRRPHIRPARDVYRYETAATATSRIPATRGACPPSARHGEGAGKVSWRRRQEGPWKWQERARSEELNREVPRLLELGGERSGAKASGKARRGLDRAERLVRRCAGLTAGPARRRGRLVGEGHPGARDDLGGGGAEASAARHRGRHPTPVRGAGRGRRWPTASSMTSAGGALLAAVLCGQLLLVLTDGVVEETQGLDEVLLGDGKRLADTVDGVGKADPGGLMGAGPVLGQRDEVRAAVGRVAGAVGVAPGGHGADVVRDCGQWHPRDLRKLADGERTGPEYRAVDRVFVGSQAGVGHRLAEQDPDPVADREQVEQERDPKIPG